ncbi:MAG: PIG-L deacetylase family protein, partial [Actinomycetota bacterium]
MQAETPDALSPLSEEWDRALAVVAHPDDLEYGAASAIARWTSQGKSVSYVLVTSGEAGIASMAPETAGPLREQEERAGAAIVGVEDVEFLGHPDGMIESGLRLRKDIARAIRRCRPHALITINHHATWGGSSFNMADHRVVGLAVMDAARDAANRWVFQDLLEGGYQPWGGVRMVCINASPYPTHAVDVTGFLAQGIRSLQAHRAYIEGLGGEFDARAFLESSAAAVGDRAGYEHAVGFEVVTSRPASHRSGFRAGALSITSFRSWARFPASHRSRRSELQRERE